MQKNRQVCQVNHFLNTFFIFFYEGVTMYFCRLKKLRLDNNLTQEDVGHILLCQREVYRRYEKGIRELPASYAIILAKHYDV